MHIREFAIFGSGLIEVCVTLIVEVDDPNPPSSPKAMDKPSRGAGSWVSAAALPVVAGS